MAEREGLPRLKNSLESPDAVPLAALAVGALSFITPFAALKENRVVDGTILNGAQIGGPVFVGAGLGLVLIVVLAQRLLSDRRKRQWVYAFVGAACVWLTAALLVKATTLLEEGAAPRVSPALGFWGLPAAAYIFLEHSEISTRRGGGWILAGMVLVPVVLILSGGRAEAVSVIREWDARKARFIEESIVHLRLFASAVLAATVLGIPMGIAASRNKKIGMPVGAFVDAAQTIPSMALFGLLMAPLAALSRAFPLLRDMGIKGIGAAPALIALTLYALLPIVKNTVTGLGEVPFAAYDAGNGLGMSPWQLFWRVEWPMALPHVLTGLRTASVQAVGNTAVAALIGAGGLGIMIFQGLGQAAPDLVLLGVFPLIALAVLVDRTWGMVIRRSVSPGLQG